METQMADEARSLSDILGGHSPLVTTRTMSLSVGDMTAAIVSR